MNIAHVSFYVDPQGRAPRELLRDWRSLGEIAGAVAGQGHAVTVIQASQRTEKLDLDGVRYRFLRSPASRAGLADSDEFVTLLQTLAPEVVHVHGLGFGAAVRRMHERMPHIPILLQDHADRVPRFWRRGAWRRGFAVAGGVSFCARAQAQPFIDSGLLQERVRVYAIPECTSAFIPGDHAAARAETGVHGEPAVLWVGHLDANKDPLTVLDGVSRAAASLPGIQLWCCFGNEALRGVMERRIAQDPRLGGRVHLLGRVPHARIEQLMRAADIYVSASHREGSGYALIEALACGLPPAVTDIPSFRELTAAGSVGRLWERGNAAALAAALIALGTAPREPARSRTRAHFDAQVSRRALGARFEHAYRELAGSHRG